MFFAFQVFGNIIVKCFLLSEVSEIQLQYAFLLSEASEM